MILRESNLKSLVPHTQFQVDFFKTFERKTVLYIYFNKISKTILWQKRHLPSLDRCPRVN